MNSAELIFEYIKKKYNFSKDKEVADKIGVNYNTLKNWVVRDSPNYQVIIDFAKTEKIDLNELFNSSLAAPSLENSPSMIALQEANAVAANENEVADYLKKFTLNKLLQKIFNKKDGFWGKLTDIIFPLTQRLIVVTYKIFKHISKDENTEIDDAKSYLIDKIQNLKLLEFEHIGITPWDIKKLVSIIENMNEDECRILIEDTNRSLDQIRQYLGFIDQITMK
ncbi:MAG: helix-turn-helix domain-containing protein [Sulfurospirillaceae bacterium]|nr:helix-turn-helix domain-containing protein [Sulfurospirillaceae bacterium]